MKIVLFVISVIVILGFTVKTCHKVYLDTKQSYNEEQFNKAVVESEPYYDLFVEAYSDSNYLTPSYDFLKNSNVTIYNIIDLDKNKGSVGTGSIIYNTEEFSYILTNRHVVEGYEKNTLLIIDGDSKYPAIVLYVSKVEDVDLALILSHKIPNKTEIQGFSAIKEQDKVYSVGAYLGHPYTYTDGNVAKSDKDQLILNLPCAYGCSGSGVFNGNGDMVGIIFAMPSMEGQADTNKMICIPFNLILSFLDEAINSIQDSK